MLSRRRILQLGWSTAAFLLIPARRTHAKPSVPKDLRDRFLRWSRMATGFAELGESTVWDCLQLVIRSGVTHENLYHLKPDAYLGTALEKRLLEAWYTGVFKIDGSPEFRNDETTLVWRVAGIDPSSGGCRGGPEFWAGLPPSA